MPATSSKKTAYTNLLLFISGIGGLLYGVDIGIIAAALLYLNQTINLSEQQTSCIVAAVLGGSMVSSMVAGVLADQFGRKKMLIVSALMFVASVGLIVISQDFTALFLGRLLQGMSGGVIAVVVPLYLAECLSADIRGRGTAIFQFMLTCGIVAASVVGLYYSRQAEAAITAAAGNSALTLAAANHAWRGMFLAVIYPGLVFLVGTFLVSESPRWLFRHRQKEQALAALRLSCSEEEAQLEMREMESARDQRSGAGGKTLGSLLQRKYAFPFILSCAILALTQTTGINSILQFLVVILKQAGMNAALATQGDLAVKLLNPAMTLCAVVLVDKKGRKFLLKLGTSGIVVALVLLAFVFHGFESGRMDVRDKVQAATTGDSLILPIDTLAPQNMPADNSPVSLTVLYTYGDGDKVATVLSNDTPPNLTITPAPKAKPPGHLVIKRAQYGDVPSPATGWLVTALLGLFIASFSVGPGVCVWLALSELMPTRIRSIGMGIALLLNQGVSTAIAALFLPTVVNYGYTMMFLFWAVCSVIFFLTVTLYLPETKGKTLEEIEQLFEKPRT